MIIKMTIVMIYKQVENLIVILQTYPANIKKYNDINFRLISGLIHDECSFNLTLYKNSSFKTGWRVKLIFKFALYKRDRGLLELIKYYLKLSNITKHGTQSIQYTVSSMEDLGILFNF